MVDETTACMTPSATVVTLSARVHPYCDTGQINGKIWVRQPEGKNTHLRRISDMEESCPRQLGVTYLSQTACGQI